MGVKTIKFLDKYFGSLICLGFGLFHKKQELGKKFENTAFIQLWGIGESITTLPAIKTFKKAYPNTKVSVICTKRVDSVFRGKEYIDEVIIVSTSAKDLINFMIKNKNKFDLVIDFEEYLNISAIMGYSIGKQVIGYANQIRSRLYDWSIPYNDQQHVAKTHMDLLKGLGKNKSFDKLEDVYFHHEAEQEIEKRLKEYGLDDVFLVGLAPGAAESSQSRMWPLERYAKIAEWLIERYNAKVVLIGSTQEEKNCVDLINFVEEGKRKKIYNFSGKTSIQELYALISRFDLLISNDSGSMHIGACLDVKTIGLFGPNLPVRFGGYGKKCLNIYKGEICEHSPCINVHKGQVPECLWGKNHKNYKICMKNLEINDVKRAVQVLV